MRRLALGLPTALQVHKNWAILFHEAGVSNFANLDDPQFYDALTFPPGNESGRIWALVDVSLLLPEPAGIFKRRGPFFVVDAMTSCSNVNPAWLGEINKKYFCMKPWSFLGILQAYVDLSSGNPQNSHFLQSPIHQDQWSLQGTLVLVPIQRVWRISQGLGSLCLQPGRLRGSCRPRNRPAST